MPTAPRHREAKRTRGPALDSYAIRIGRHREIKLLGSGALSEEGSAVRPSTSPTRTHDQLTAVLHRPRNPHPQPPVHPKGDRRDRLARFCAETLIKNHVAPSRSNSKRRCTSKTRMVCKSKPGVAPMVCLGKPSRMPTCLPQPRI